MTYELISQFPLSYQLDLAIVEAARVSYQNRWKGEDKDKRLLKYLLENRHSSPFEHAEFLFSVSNKSFVLDILLDNRIMTSNVSNTKGQMIYVRIDLNNAIRVLQYYPDHDLANFLLKQIQVFSPWLYGVIIDSGIAKPVMSEKDQATDTTYPDTEHHREYVSKYGFIQLMNSFPDSERAILYIAREIYPEFKELSDATIFLELNERKDYRIYGLFSLSVRVSAPLMVIQQWLRHRMGRYNSQSGRYVEFEPSFYLPEEWRGQSGINKQMSDGVLETDFSSRLKDHFRQSYRLYNDAVTREGISRELARLALPGFATHYELVITNTLFGWLHFISLRDTPEAQPEIREYASKIKSYMNELMPMAMRFNDV